MIKTHMFSHFESLISKMGYAYWMKFAICGTKTTTIVYMRERGRQGRGVDCKKCLAKLKKMPRRSKHFV